jgi:hypothetical protein
MLITLMSLAALSCPKTIMVNHTSHPWNDHDRSVLETAKKRCGQIYPDAPCVKEFYKIDKQDYHVTCGAA